MFSAGRSSETHRSGSRAAARMKVAVVRPTSGSSRSSLDCMAIVDRQTRPWRRPLVRPCTRPVFHPTSDQRTGTCLESRLPSLGRLRHRRRRQGSALILGLVEAMAPNNSPAQPAPQRSDFSALRNADPDCVHLPPSNALRQACFPRLWTSAPTARHSNSSPLSAPPSTTVRASARVTGRCGASRRATTAAAAAAERSMRRSR